MNDLLIHPFTAHPKHTLSPWWGIGAAVLAALTILLAGGYASLNAYTRSTTASAEYAAGNYPAAVAHYTTALAA